MDLRTHEDGLARLPERLAPMFGGANPTFLSDSRTLVNALNQRNLTARHSDELSSMTDADLANVVILPVQFKTAPAGKDIEKYLRDSAMLVLPIASFCGSDQGALYFLEKLGHMDVDMCVRGIVEWLDRVSSEETIRMIGAGTDITVEISDEVFVMSPKTSKQIQPGEWASIAQYLEVALISYNATNRPNHHMEGTLAAEGAVVSYHRYAAPHVAAVAHDTWAFLESVRKDNPGEPFVIQVEDSQAVSVTCGGRDVYPEIVAFANKAEHPYVGEFAFASDRKWDIDTVDWSVNSQLNEAVGGLHIGLGNGVNGAHIDFVAPRAAMA
jgi:hypothetical protein